MSEVETGPAGVRGADVRVSAQAEQVPLVRSFAADIAMRLDFDLDTIEDVRMAVDEACSMLVRGAVEGTSLFCSFEPVHGEVALRVRAHVDAVRATPPSADPMGWQILTALADEVRETVEPTDGGHRITVDLVVRAGETAAR